MSGVDISKDEYVFPFGMKTHSLSKTVMRMSQYEDKSSVSCSKSSWMNLISISV